MKMYGLLDTLDFSKGGIPETGQVTKNRHAMLIVDRKRDTIKNTMADIARLVYDLYNDRIDTVTVDVKRLTLINIH